MIKALLNGILNVITYLLNIVLYPINILFANLFPDMTSSINTFNTFVSRYLSTNLTYFFHIWK